MLTRSGRPEIDPKMGPSASYAAPFVHPQLATSIKTAASSATAALKNQSEGGKEQEKGENKSISANSDSLGFNVAYHPQQQSSYHQQPYCCPCGGRQRPCECANSQSAPKLSSSLEFDPMEQQHYSRQTHCSPSGTTTAKSAHQDANFGGSNNDSNNNTNGGESLGHLYDSQGQNNQFSYRIHQQPSSQSGQELEISRCGGGPFSESHQRHLSYNSNYSETDECWTLTPLSDNNQPIPRASQFREPTFSSSQTTNSRGEQQQQQQQQQRQQQQQQVSYGYGLYSNFNNKNGSFEDVNDFNNNDQRQHHQNSVFPSGHHIAPSPVSRDPPYNYQQAHSTSTSQEQVYTTNSSFYSIAPDCNQTSDYATRHQQHFQPHDGSCNAQGLQPMRTVAPLEVHHNHQREQPTHNSTPFTSSNTFQQRQDCSSYGPITSQQQHSDSHRIPSLRQPINDSIASNQTPVDNNQCYDDDQHVQPHRQYQSQQQHMVTTQNHVANNEQYPGQSYRRQPTTNCDGFTNQISATTNITSPSATDGGMDLIRTPNSKSRSLKGRRGRPRKKSIRSKNKVNGKLWEFIRDLLLSERTNPSFIRWERREDGVFKFVKSDKVAKMWGERKQNPKMTYEKLSRAMRYYYKSKVLLPVFGRRLVYKFGPNATGWMPET